MTHCNLCNKPLKGSSQGGAHIGCYIRAHPPNTCVSAYDLVYSPDDPVYARDEVLRLLEKLPAETVKAALSVYNKRLLTSWQRCCDIYKVGE